MKIRTSRYLRPFEDNFLAPDRHLTIELDRLLLGIAVALPVRWRWDGWESNSLFFWSPRHNGFQCRVIFVQFGWMKKA